MFNKQAFLEELDQVIERKKMLSHPFYQTWSKGELSRDALREYARQYYHFVHAFPTLLSATHANTPVLEVRQTLLENLIEEERGESNHPALWKQFCSALGVDVEQRNGASLFPETRNCVHTLVDIARNRSFLAGVSALYAYESQIPKVARVKMEGLITHYGIDDPRALEFFSVHEKADVYHSASEWEIISDNCSNEHDAEVCLTAASESAGAMLLLLDGMYHNCVLATVSE